MKVNTIIILSVLVLVVCGQAVAFQRFQNEIPNGYNVPHPCKPNYKWKGVGHFKDSGTGLRNVFGEDFQAAGYKWTIELCRKDSDGDGRTNGEELGDPNCVWKTENNEPPEGTSEITHPGVCDLYNSAACMRKPVKHSEYKTQEEWMSEQCKEDEFVCDGINDENVQKMTVQIPETVVPAKETIYMCYIFEVNEDSDLHLIATEPALVNKGVMHHLGLLGCEDDVAVTDKAFECDMEANAKCSTVVSIWSVGIPGECFYKEAGVRIGRNGFKKMAFQIHWNNPEEIAGMTDSSGLILYLTPNLRPFDAGIFSTGTSGFVLDPLQPEIKVTGHCSSTCTRSFMTGPIYVTSAWNHMHYAGRKMYLEVIRNGRKLLNLTDDAFYSYDSPHLYIKETPVEILPGDEINTVCTFSTLDRTKSTISGDGTQDEMCFGFINYYPKQNLKSNSCTNFHGISFCDASTFNGCNNPASLSLNASVEMQKVTRFIKENCLNFFPCVPECKDFLVREFKTNPCMQGNSWKVQKEFLKRADDPNNPLLPKLASCEREIGEALSSRDSDSGVQFENNFPSASSVIDVSVITCVALLAAFVLTYN